MSSRTDLGDSESSLPSWIFDHLGEKSSMADEVNMSSSSPQRHFSSSKGGPLEVYLPSFKKENIMTLEDVNRLTESYSFPLCVQIRLPEAGKKINSARLSEVAFYEAAFHAGLHFPIHPTIRMILQFYNICPTQFVPNAWNLFSLNKKPKADQGWLYFKARPKKGLLEGYPSNVKGWNLRLERWLRVSKRSRKGGRGANGSEVMGSKRCNGLPRYSGMTQIDLASSIEQKGFYSVPDLLKSKTFCRRFELHKPKALKNAGEERLNAPTLSGDVPGNQVAFLELDLKLRSYDRSMLPSELKSDALVLGSSLVSRAGRHGKRHLFSKAGDDLAKIKEKWDAFVDKFERSGVLVVELREALTRAKDSAMEEFKSSSYFLRAIEDAASKYFGEGFDFYKRQLRRHHHDRNTFRVQFLDNGDIHNDDQDALSQSNKWAFLILTTSIMAIKTPYHKVMNVHS
ncbi:DNA polymerase [Actinidia chinensis var. chinensis]|uniref:DNA polymerase n=1 Tax=Actinidia chinensis var. chinensis TaxID=1590841 RepID=A0A2R6QP03_ACTCC|nr:DNA polymerase [Actinidia chinensis var. chinensis]